jgi:predicted nucleic acid-binding protein
MEPRFGARLQLSRNALFAQELEQWIETVIMVNCSDRSLPFDTAIALRTGMLPTPDKRPSPDAMIAATTVHHGLTVVTRNVSDLAALGVTCLDPWRYPT